MMPRTVLDTIQSLTTGELLRTTARQLGESEPAVSMALSSAGAVLLARLSQVSGDAVLMNRVAGLIEPPGHDDSASRHYSDPGDVAYVPPPVSVAGSPTHATTKLGRGATLLSVVLGSRLQTLVEALAEDAEISVTSARAIMGHAAPLVLKALGIRLDHTSIEPAGLAPSSAQLADLLTRERESFMRAAPAVLMSVFESVRPGSGSTVVLPPIPPLAGREAPGTQLSSGDRSAAQTGSQGHRGGGLGSVLAGTRLRFPAVNAEVEGSSFSNPALIAGLVILALLWWLFLPGLYATYSLRVDPAVDSYGRSVQSRAGGQRPVAPPEPFTPTGPGTAAGGTFSGPTSVTPSSSAAPSAVTGLLRLIKRTLPSNKQIDYIEDGIEGRMIALIENRGRPLERTEWFEFDRLNFQTGSSNLTAESRAQVQNIADILASYPGVKIKIGGYTDNVGDPQANQRLSEARAQRVMTELITLGVNALRLDAEGYGDQHPIADNATSEGRARNRRIAVRITAR